MPQPLTIRPVEAADRADWQRLWTGYLAFYETTVEARVYDTTFARLLSAETGEFHGLIACIDGHPVGLVHFLFHRHCWKVENVCYLQDLFTDPAARGRGVARALIEAVYARADAEGAPAVWWLTQEFNYTGRMLYDRIGVRTPFIRYNRREGPVFPRAEPQPANKAR
ncbi:MAG: GNAT family N-acetyltransferase [Gemmobacter sp.]